MKRSFGIVRSIADELKRLRKSRDMNLDEVGEKVGVSGVFISNIERGKRVPSDNLIEKLAEVYDIEELDLYEGFGKVPESIINEIIHNPKLLELLYKITNNPNFPNEKKEQFYSDINELYDKINKPN